MRSLSAVRIVVAAKEVVAAFQCGDVKGVPIKAMLPILELPGDLD